MFCPGMQWEVYLDGFESSGKRVTIQGVPELSLWRDWGQSPRHPGQAFKRKSLHFFGTLLLTF